MNKTITLEDHTYHHEELIRIEWHKDGAVTLGKILFDTGDCEILLLHDRKNIGNLYYPCRNAKFNRRWGMNRWHLLNSSSSAIKSIMPYCTKPRD